MPAEEKKLLIDFGNILGTTDIEGQISSIAAQITLMEGLREQRMAEYRQKGRLYRSLGVMAGVMIGIIII
nr:stage III sporulation protein AB [Ruminococcus flavefaciens]